MCDRIVRVLLSGSQNRHPFPHSGLQLFADGGDGTGDGDGPGEENDSGDDEGDDDEGDDDKDQSSFDGFLRQKGNQKEFDRRVQAAVNKAVSAARTKWQSMTDDKLSEAEKLAKMTKDERAEYVRQKERQEFEAEKQAFEREKCCYPFCLTYNYAGCLSQN